MIALTAAPVPALDSVFEASIVGPVLQGGQFVSLAVVFIILALAAYVVGARGIAGITMRIAYILIIIFIVLAIISFFI